MIKQQQALLETEGVQMEFTDAAIREISRVAEEVSLICLYKAADLSSTETSTFHVVGCTYANQPFRDDSKRRQ